MSPTDKPAGQLPEARYERVHIEDYWRVVRRRAWLILLTTLVAVLAALWAASRSPQLYRSALTLRVGDPRGRLGQLGDLDLTPNMLWTDPVESELQQLSTQAIAQWVVDSLQLRAQSRDLPRALLLADVQLGVPAVPGEYRVQVGAGGTVELRDGSESSARGATGQPLAFPGGSLVVRGGVEPGTYTLEVISQSAAEALVSGGLAASIRPETNLIDVTYTGTDESLAPRILNAVAAALRNLGVSRARDWASARSEFIRGRLEEAGTNLRSALQAVEEYKQDRGLATLSAEESRVLQRMSALQSELEAALLERSIYQRLVSQVSGSGLQPRDIQQFALLSSAEASRSVRWFYDELLQLLEERANQVGPKGKHPSHPDVVALDSRIAETQQQLLAAAQNATGPIDARIDVLTSSLAQLHAELRALPTVETALARLEGQVEIYSDTYKYLLARYQESQISEAEISPYVEVLDPANRAWPVSGGRRLNVLLGGLLGLMLGVVAAFFLEYLDRSVQSTTDVEASLGIPVVGWIPRMEGGAEGAILVAAVNDPEGSAAEAYRVLRTNLAFSTAREAKLSSLVFTSPGPAEGKSTTVANLAAVLAARGDRTLLVDADLRRGCLHEPFDLMRSPGLSELLVGQIDAREAIRPDIRPGLDVLPAGMRPPNPSELLGSQAMANLLAAWRTEYRWVVLDAPPVLAVADAVVLAALTDGTALVLRAGVTDRRAAYRATQQLGRVGTRVVGVVLNEVKPQSAADRYYLNYYYERGRS